IFRSLARQIVMQYIVHTRMTDITFERELFDSNNDQLLDDEKLLATHVKEFEAISDQRLDSSYPFVVRIDGVSFRNYTRGFTKPYDQ
ncbi:unnamed protein product, partial [Rotaria socialis]